MSAYTPVNPGLTGAAPALAAVSASDTFANKGKMLLHVHNGNAGTVTITVKDRGSVAPAGASAFDGDVVKTVLAGADTYLGPFDVARFNDASGLVTVQYSPTSSVTAEVVDAN